MACSCNSTCDILRRAVAFIIDSVMEIVLFAKNKPSLTAINYNLSPLHNTNGQILLFLKSIQISTTGNIGFYASWA